MATEWLLSGSGMAFKWYLRGVRQPVQTSIYDGFGVEVSVCVRVFVMRYRYFVIPSSRTHSKISNAHSLLTFLHSSRVSLEKPACRRQYVRMALHPFKTKRTLLHYG